MKRKRSKLIKEKSANPTQIMDRIKKINEEIARLEKEIANP
jgi:hypothetical protein